MRRMTLLIILIFTVVQSGGKVQAKENPPELSARTAALIDVESGRLLYEKQAEKQMRIASLTKIMTAIVAIENGSLKQLVTVGPNAVGVEGSSIYLKQGEKIPLESLLYGLMLRSGNDAAVAIAEHIGGSVEGFVFKMNEKAEFIGLNGTHFQNPSGLDSPRHYSTAQDMAKLTAYALRNQTFQKIVSTPVKTVPWPGEKWHRKWYNKNKILRLYSGANGVKTGYTKLSKRTLVASASRNGRQLATVTLNASDDWNDSMLLLEYGFSHFQRVKLIHRGKVFPTQPDRKGKFKVVARSDFIYPLKPEERKKVQIKPIMMVPLKKVDREGLKVGNAWIYLDEQPVGSVDLITEMRAEKAEKTAFSDWWRIFAQVVGREG